MLNLNDLVNHLNEYRIPFHKQSEDIIVFDLEFYTDSGHSCKEEIEVCFQNDVLQVRVTNDRYPNFCPNRHINVGGYFCLDLQENLDKLSIREWMRKVKLFLEAQQECEKNREWPSNDFKQWAHGDGAHYQKVVEKYYAEFLNISKSIGLTLSQLKVVERVNGSGKKFYHVYIGDKQLLAGDEKQPLGKRCACVCSKNGIKQHRTIGKCPSQCAKIIYIVAINDYFVKKAEEEFWEAYKKVGLNTCCGTMKECKLKLS